MTAMTQNTGYQLTANQIKFFQTFGYILAPRLLVEDIEEVSKAFDEVMANAGEDLVKLDYSSGDRFMVPAVLDRHPTLDSLKHDPRILGIVESLIGKDWEYAESDGNIMDCETTWHRDTYESPLSQLHVKLLFYLEPLTTENGALRVLPGTNFYKESYAKSLQKGLGFPDRMDEVFGIDGTQLPAVPLETNPGDAIILNFRTLHASYRGSPGRRLFTINYREPDSSKD